MWQIASIGEVLLDLLPTGARLGGAPAAAAWYCAETGAQGWLLSAVGEDKHGRRVLRDLQERRLPADYVVKNPAQPTGEVRVHYDANGKAIYHFLEDVAWDHLQMTPSWAELAGKVNAVIFGTVAQRAEESRKTIYEFLDAAAPDALRLFDLHLRYPYYSSEILEQSFRRASAAKMSRSELPVVARWLGMDGADGESVAKVLMERYPALRCIALTRGEDGSLLFTRGKIYECGGFYADQFVNGSGSGEAFSVVLCLGILNGADLQAVNEEANRAACCVCCEPDTLAPLSDEVLDNLQKARII